MASKRRESTTRNGSIDHTSLAKQKSSIKITDQKPSQHTELKISDDLDSDNTSTKNDKENSTGSLANLYRFADFDDYQVIYKFCID